MFFFRSVRYTVTMAKDSKTGIGQHVLQKRGPSSPMIPDGTKPHFSSTLCDAIFAGSVSASTRQTPDCFNAQAVTASTASVA